MRKRSNVSSCCNNSKIVKDWSAKYMVVTKNVHKLMRSPCMPYFFLMLSNIVDK